MPCGLVLGQLPTEIANEWQTVRVTVCVGATEKRGKRTPVLLCGDFWGGGEWCWLRQMPRTSRYNAAWDGTHHNLLRPPRCQPRFLSKHPLGMLLHSPRKSSLL